MSSGAAVWQPAVHAISCAVDNQGNSRRLEGKVEGRRLDGHCDAEMAGLGFNEPGIDTNCESVEEGAYCAVSCLAGYTLQIATALLYVCNAGTLEHAPPMTAMAIDPAINGFGLCSANECTQGYPSTVGVTHDCDGKTTGQSCIASCGPGYDYDTGSGVRMFTCENTGFFSGEAPVCVAAACTYPLNLGQAYNDAACSGTTTGSVCYVACADGYTLTGAPTAYTCETSGSFTGSLPTCTPEPCPGGWPTDSDLDTTGCDSLKTDETCTVSCADPYTGSSATFTCSAAAGQAVTGVRPTCEPKLCPDLEVIEGISHTCQGITYGSKCELECMQAFGYGFGFEEITCDWDVATQSVQLVYTLTCTPQPCFVDDLNSNTYSHDCAGVTVGSSCTITCEPGYAGPTTVMECRGTSAFPALTGTVPTCSLAPCDPNPTYLTQYGSYAGDCVASYTEQCYASCANGFSGVPALQSCDLVGNAIIPVLVGTGPDCLGLPCQDNIPQGLQYVHECDNVSTSTSCTVSCNIGYTATPTTLSCTISSYPALLGSFPNCLPMECPPRPIFAVEDTCDGATFDSICIASCVNGYIGVSREFLCTWNFTLGTVTLQGDEPECTPQACTSNIPTGSQYVHACSGTLTDQSCIVSCAEGYVGDPQTLTCTSSSFPALAGSLPNCVAPACGIRSEFGSTDDCLTTGFGQSCTASCAYGFSGPSVTWTCLWNAAQNTNTLQGTATSCVLAFCPYNVPSSVDYSHNCQQVAPASSCTVQCFPGFSGTATTMTCSSTGHLVGGSPTCTRMVCPARPEANVVDTCYNVLFESSCTAYCAPGFIGSSKTWTCGSVGDTVVLQGTTPVCYPAPTPAPTTPPTTTTATSARTTILASTTTGVPVIIPSPVPTPAPSPSPVPSPVPTPRPVRTTTRTTTTTMKDPPQPFIYNGGFERGLKPTTAVSVTSIPSWTLAPVPVRSGFFAFFRSGYNRWGQAESAEGSSFLGLLRPTATISQRVKHHVVGRKYTVYFSSAKNSSSPETAVLRINITGEASPLGVRNNLGWSWTKTMQMVQQHKYYINNHEFTQKGFIYTAPEKVVRITVSNDGPSGCRDCTVFVDHMRIVKVESPTIWQLRGSATVKEALTTGNRSATSKAHLPCGLMPAKVCSTRNSTSGRTELGKCYYDVSCSYSPARFGGIGCNAGGHGRNCRFCGFGHYHSCPVPHQGYPCSTVAAPICMDLQRPHAPPEMCIYDASCSTGYPGYGGLGCNAGSGGINCRYCGFREYPPCTMRVAV
mmetsp:Transcript_63567/g.143147  ORF Transcript_63567/g.143147 Transcript_63567/m.143147 type:complete len:1272 (+) Transcript_63567:2-3817(+)